MALRVCHRFLTDSLVLSRCAKRHAPCWPPTAPAAPPPRFLSSKTLLHRLGRTAGGPGDASQSPLAPGVPADQSEQLSLLTRSPDQPARPRLLRVAIIGPPNAGKSTLSNQLLGRKVFAVSKKVHTTRSRATGVLTEGDTQIVLLDTPGLTTPGKVKRHQLEQSLLRDPWSSVREADLIVAMVDVADRWMSSRLDLELLKCLAQNQDIPAVLVLNKVDLLKAKNKLLDITAELTCGFLKGRKLRPVIRPPWAQKSPARKLLPEEEEPGPEMDGAEPGLDLLKEQRGWPHFRDVFMLSSVDHQDVQTLKSYFLLAARPAAWDYHSEVLTDQSPELLCHNMVREKLLEHLPQEVPYSLTQTLDYWQETEGQLDVCVKLHARKANHVRMVIGAGGQMVAQMATEVSEDLSRLFLRQVRLKLSVTLEK